ncbi:NAD(+) diphosphatase [Bifidobacterium sp. ESL0790]|uniref:NAD(+) diphosphatase n=1 Tax=Bifidobacterium sp. ESL0790 TaxID=2983233 RepID=UPI0023F969E5|nr:NAD(+) diphosphatase [Bifidobacterium sp. ESL0790]WEV72200.1 NAD(+) diphosphatase [Bifidobacterium sp. ESL0790]
MNATFSPLALTQALPFLPMARGDLDTQTERRTDPEVIATALSDPKTTVILLRDGLLAVPDGQAERVDYQSAKIRLASLPSEYVAKALAGAGSKVLPIFLGASGGAEPHDVVAVDVSALGDDADSSDSSHNEQGNNWQTSNSASASTTLFERAMERFDWVSLHGFAPHASAREVGWAVPAVALSMWHRSQRHCSLCGSLVRPALAGWAQLCSNPSCEHTSKPLFPRIEPAVIVSIVDHADRLLLQHNRAWPNPAQFSVCAGFVEAGENLEHACRRESREETGLELGEVKYLGSQPWPFPASLMVAFKGQALGTDVAVDGNETVEARFFTRAEFTQALATGEIAVPATDTIARYMMEEWYGQKL